MFEVKPCRHLGNQSHEQDLDLPRPREEDLIMISHGDEETWHSFEYEKLLELESNDPHATPTPTPTPTPQKQLTSKNEDNHVSNNLVHLFDQADAKESGSNTGVVHGFRAIEDKDLEEGAPLSFKRRTCEEFLADGSQNASAGEQNHESQVKLSRDKDQEQEQEKEHDDNNGNIGPSCFCAIS